MNLKIRKEAITNAEGIFTGGGNTFLLVFQLYKKQADDRFGRYCKKTERPISAAVQAVILPV